MSELAPIADVIAWAEDALDYEIKEMADNPLCLAARYRTVLAALKSQAALSAPQVAPEGWQPIETRPPNLSDTYLVANENGQVAPWIRGVIHNNPGTAWDWDYVSTTTHWMPLPNPPSIPETKP